MKTEVNAQKKTVLILKQVKNVRDDYFRELFTGSTLLTHQEKSPISCWFCKMPQKRKNCCIISGIRTRKNIVRKSKRCFVCWKDSDLAKDCSLKIKCFKWSKRHHVAFSDSEESGPSSNSSSVTHFAGVDDNTNILLETARFKVTNGESSYLNSAWVLFESCSQLSYITPELHNPLILKTVGTRKISIQTFRNDCSENILQKVNLRI